MPEPFYLHTKIGMGAGKPKRLEKADFLWENKGKFMKKSFTIRELPKIERPREKLISKGPQNLKEV